MSVDAQSAISSPAALDRPFYFIVVLWGERFRDSFLDFCLASALSPGNIPALQKSRRSKYLITTRPKTGGDGDAPMFRLLKSFLEPVYIEIPPCPPGRSGYQHMSIGHRIACERRASRRRLCGDPHAGLHAVGRRCCALAAACAEAARNSFLRPRCASARSRFWRTCANWVSCQRTTTARTPPLLALPAGRWSMPPSTASIARHWPMNGMHPASWPSVRRRGGVCPAKTASCCTA